MHRPKGQEGGGGRMGFKQNYVQFFLWGEVVFVVVVFNLLVFVVIFLFWVFFVAFVIFFVVVVFVAFVIVFVVGVFAVVQSCIISVPSCRSGLRAGTLRNKK